MGGAIRANSSGAGAGSTCSFTMSCGNNAVGTPSPGPGQGSAMSSPALDPSCNTLRGLRVLNKGLTTVGDQVARLADLQELVLWDTTLTHAPVGAGELLYNFD